MSYGLVRGWCLIVLFRLEGGGERPILVSAVPVGPGTNIGRCCKFLGSVIRFLGGLPGGLARFMPRSIGAHHVGCVIWAGKSVDMVSLLGPGKPLILVFWMLFWRFLGTLLGLVEFFWLVSYL